MGKECMLKCKKTPIFYSLQVNESKYYLNGIYLKMVYEGVYMALACLFLWNVLVPRRVL